MDVVPDPVDIHVRVDAVVLEQRHRHAGDGRGFHVGKGALEHAQAAHTDDGFDLSRLDEGHDDRAALRHEHRVAEPLGLGLQILNRAQPALLAEQAEFIERRGAFRFHAQAFRQQQQPALEGDGSKRLAPHFVVQQHADVVAVNGLATELRHEPVGVDFQLVRRHRRHRRVLGHVGAHALEDVLPLHKRLRNVLLRRTNGLHRHSARKRDRRGGWKRGWRHEVGVLARKGKRQGSATAFPGLADIAHADNPAGPDLLAGFRQTKTGTRKDRVPVSANCGNVPR